MTAYSGGVLIDAAGHVIFVDPVDRPADVNVSHLEHLIRQQLPQAARTRNRSSRMTASTKPKQNGNVCNYIAQTTRPNGGSLRCFDSSATSGLNRNTTILVLQDRLEPIIY